VLLSLRIIAMSMRPISSASLAASPRSSSVTIPRTSPTSHLIGRITTAGKLSHYPVPTAQAFPQSITAGPDGALWFTERGGKIGRITSAGAITEFAVHPPKGRTLFGIVAGPDGALWFTEPNDKTIGRITTAGKVTEYAVPSGHPTGIALGPDGALWFTSVVPSMVSRIDTHGAIAQYPLATSFDKPGGIAAGSDGALWFTIYSSDKIARIVPPKP
jgi:virginiamycin B lyase